MLAQYLTWHLRRAWAPLTYTDPNPPPRTNPVTAAQRSDAATAKARTKTNPDGEPVRSFRGLLGHLGTLTRNTTIFAERHLDILATRPPKSAPTCSAIPTWSASPSPGQADSSSAPDAEPNEPHPQVLTIAPNGTVSRTVFLARHAGLRSGGMGTVSDDIVTRRAA
jgi:hypothetical protein